MAPGLKIWGGGASRNVGEHNMPHHWSVKIWGGGPCAPLPPSPLPPSLHNADWYAVQKTSMKRGLVSEGIFTLVPSSKKFVKSLSFKFSKVDCAHFLRITAISKWKSLSIFSNLYKKTSEKSVKEARTVARADKYVVWWKFLTENDHRADFYLCVNCYCPVYLGAVL